MLKQFKNYNTCSNMFWFTQEPSSGAVLCLAQTTEYGFSVFIGIDAVNGSASTMNCMPAQQADMLP